MCWWYASAFPFSQYLPMLIGATASGERNVGLGALDGENRYCDTASASFRG
jgi:hypothetical protein